MPRPISWEVPSACKPQLSMRLRSYLEMKPCLEASKQLWGSSSQSTNLETVDAQKGHFISCLADLFLRSYISKHVRQVKLKHWVQASMPSWGERYVDSRGSRWGSSRPSLYPYCVTSLPPSQTPPWCIWWPIYFRRQERACVSSSEGSACEAVLDFVLRTGNSSRAISNTCSFKLLLSQAVQSSPKWGVLDIFKKSESMADLPDDLNFGVTMEGTVPNVPPPRPAEPAPKVSDEASAANSDRFDLKRAGHPVACIATFGFKAAGIFFYLLVGSFISNISTFIIVIILSSLDFWVVKNITGRLLVGLRWWSEIDKSGKEQWRFENPSEGRVVNPVDNAFFWFSQAVGTLVWGILFILKVLTLGVFWALLLFVCTSLCGTNLYAYYQCRGDHQKKLGELKKKGMMQFIGKAFG